ncbi:hypothetical protein AS889_00620 [Pseudomonas putida]|uniref:hypothetical protein n=1 Tax=Pseudomonas putida TaxID=303 RepID=UPI00077171BF|nr:hypothetical protein [Pseudomonas putida]KWW20260.1 hypothetical protein AS889_00620 [Pseudomonas putida]
MTRLALCLLLLAVAGLVASSAWLAYEMRKLGQSHAITSCVEAGNERQLSPHEKDSGPTPALAPGRWIDERYQL